MLSRFLWKFKSSWNFFGYEGNFCLKYTVRDIHSNNEVDQAELGQSV